MKLIMTELKADVSRDDQEVKTHSDQDDQPSTLPRAREFDHDLVSEPAEAWNQEEEAMKKEASEKSDDWLVPINSNQLKDD